MESSELGHGEERESDLEELADGEELPAGDDQGLEDEEVEVPEKPIVKPTVEMIRLEDIHEPDNIRHELTHLEELASSIRAQGLIHPVVVRPRPDDAEHDKPYELVVGYRRKAAFELLGKEEIPAQVISADDREVLLERITENLQREDHSPMAEARAMQQMIDVFGMTHAEVAAYLGVSRPQVTKRLSLLGLPEKVQEMVEQEQITPSHAEVIASLPEAEEQEEVAELAVRTETPVSKLSSYVKKIKEEKEKVEQAQAAASSGEASPEEIIEVVDQDTPLEVVRPEDVTELPALKVKEDLSSEQLDMALLYLLLRNANDVEMLEYLEERLGIGWHDLWDYVVDLTPEQRRNQIEVMIRRYLGAAHRYPTFPAELCEELGEGEVVVGFNAGPDLEGVELEPDYGDDWGDFNIEFSDDPSDEPDAA